MNRVGLSINNLNNAIWRESTPHIINKLPRSVLTLTIYLILANLYDRQTRGVLNISKLKLNDFLLRSLFKFAPMRDYAQYAHPGNYILYQFFIFHEVKDTLQLRPSILDTAHIQSRHSSKHMDSQLQGWICINFSIL